MPWTRELRYLKLVETSEHQQKFLRTWQFGEMFFNLKKHKAEAPNKWHYTLGYRKACEDNIAMTLGGETRLFVDQPWPKASEAAIEFMWRWLRKHYHGNLLQYGDAPNEASPQYVGVRDFPAFIAYNLLRLGGWDEPYTQYESYLRFLSGLQFKHLDVLDSALDDIQARHEEIAQALIGDQRMYSLDAMDTTFWGGTDDVEHQEGDSPKEDLSVTQYVEVRADSGTGEVHSSDPLPMHKGFDLCWVVRVDNDGDDVSWFSPEPGDMLWFFKCRDAIAEARRYLKYFWGPLAGHIEV